MIYKAWCIFIIKSFSKKILMYSYYQKKYSRKKKNYHVTNQVKQTDEPYQRKKLLSI